MAGSGAVQAGVPNTGAAQPYPQFPMQGGGVQTPQAMGVGGIPSTVQRMPGGFGISPQLLQMIAQLQNRTPTNAFNPQQFMPKPKAPVIQNPYARNYGAPGVGGPGSGGSGGGGGPGAGGPGGGS